jgi:hypothetical protein
LIGFSSEPKYYSLIIIVALGILLYTENKLKFDSILKFLLLAIALTLSMAFTGFLVIGLAILYLLIYSNINNLEKTKVALVIVLPFMIPLLKNFTFLLLLLGSYSGERWDSFNYSVAGFDNFNVSNLTLFGVGDLEAEAFGSTLSLYISQMGIFWGFFVMLFIFTVVEICFKRLKFTSKIQSFGLILIITAFQIYNFVFLSQAITPLMIFAFVILISEPYKSDLKHPIKGNRPQEPNG